MTRKRNRTKKAETSNRSLAQMGVGKSIDSQTPTISEDSFPPVPSTDQLTGWAIQLLASRVENDIEEAAVSALATWKECRRALVAEKDFLKLFEQRWPIPGRNKAAQDREARIAKRAWKDYAWAMSAVPLKVQSFAEVAKGFYGSEPNPDQALKDFLARNGQKNPGEEVQGHSLMQWALLRAREDFERASTEMSFTRKEKKKAERNKKLVDSDSIV